MLPELARVPVEIDCPRLDNGFRRIRVSLGPLIDPDKLCKQCCNGSGVDLACIINFQGEPRSLYRQSPTDPIVLVDN